MRDVPFTGLGPHTREDRRGGGRLRGNRGHHHGAQCRTISRSDWASRRASDPPRWKEEREPGQALRRPQSVRGSPSPRPTIRDYLQTWGGVKQVVEGASPLRRDPTCPKARGLPRGGRPCIRLGRFRRTAVVVWIWRRCGPPPHHSVEQRDRPRRRVAAHGIDPFGDGARIHMGLALANALGRAGARVPSFAPTPPRVFSPPPDRSRQPSEQPLERSYGLTWPNRLA